LWVRIVDNGVAVGTPAWFGRSCATLIAAMGRLLGGAGLRAAVRRAGLRVDALRTPLLRLGFAGRFFVAECLFMTKL
jgi:hypothetical protein